jgi:hypothetical protein
MSYEYTNLLKNRTRRNLIPNLSTFKVEKLRKKKEGVVLLDFQPREYHFGRPYYQKPVLAMLVTTFLFPVAYKNKFLTLWK